MQEFIFHIRFRNFRYESGHFYEKYGNASIFL